ncbi:hypothetical protein [Leptotrichia sp. OH3620_COT-345]|nr:hypothetical protein [Leptotrichia sp. OH3620_COT-345]
MKKIIMMIIIGIMLGSCGILGLARYGIEKTISDFKEDELTEPIKE